MGKTWMITGVSSGFGYEMTRQLLEKGDTVIGTVRTEKSRKPDCGIPVNGKRPVFSLPRCAGEVSQSDGGANHGNRTVEIYNVSLF